MKYAKAWLAIQSLLLISACAGVKFNGFHITLTVVCLLYTAAVWRAMVWAKKGK